jgi:hypothetical protein
MTESVHRAASALVCRSYAAIRKTHAAALMTAAPRPFTPGPGDRGRGGKGGGGGLRGVGPFFGLTPLGFQAT